MHIYEAKATKPSHNRKELHHLRIHAASGATTEHPSWLVIHEYEPPEAGQTQGLFGRHKRHEPVAYHFDDHEAMMQHLHDHTHPDMNPDEDEKGGE